MSNEICLILQDAYNPTVVGYIVGEDTAKKYCAQNNYELKKNMENQGKTRETELDYTHNILKCVNLNAVANEQDIKDYNFLKEYILEFQRDPNNGSSYTLLSYCVSDYYISEIERAPIFEPNESYDNIHITLTALDDEQAISQSTNILQHELDKKGTRDIIHAMTVQETLSTDFSERSDSDTLSADGAEHTDELLRYAEAIAPANRDMSVEQIVEKLKTCTWTVIADIAYEDSSAKIYRTTELNSNANCVDLKDLATTEGEQFIVTTNKYGEKMVYLANNSIPELTVDYADMVIDTVDGTIFSPLTVMQAVNEELDAEIQDGTVYDADVLSMLRIQMVALHPNVQV